MGNGADTSRLSVFCVFQILKIRPQYENQLVSEYELRKLFLQSLKRCQILHNISKKQTLTSVKFIIYFLIQSSENLEDFPSAIDHVGKCF